MILEPLCVTCRGRPTDVYALGACLFTFLYGRIPFNAPNVFKLFQVSSPLQPCLADVTLPERSPGCCLPVLPPRLPAAFEAVPPVCQVTWVECRSQPARLAPLLACT